MVFSKLISESIIRVIIYFIVIDFTLLISQKRRTGYLSEIKYIANSLPDLLLSAYSSEW